jgi:hypothetical protein
VDDDLLRQRIRDLVDRLPNMHRQDRTEEIFKLVKEYQLAETKDATITPTDLSQIYDRTLKEYQDLRMPFHIDGQQVTEQQRKTYCYLIGVVNVLRRLGLLKRQIHANKDQPLHEPVED